MTDPLVSAIVGGAIGMLFTLAVGGLLVGGKLGRIELRLSTVERIIRSITSVEIRASDRRFPHDPPPGAGGLYTGD